MLNLEKKNEIKTIEALFFILNYKIDLSLKFSSFFKDKVKNNHYFSLSLFYNIVLNEIKKELEDPNSVKFLDFDEFILKEDHKSIQIIFKKNIITLLKFILFLLKTNKIENNEKSFKNLNKIIFSLENLNIIKNKNELDLIISLEKILKEIENKEDKEKYEKFHFTDLTTIEKNKYTFNFEKKEIEDKNLFKNQLNDMIVSLENYDSTEDIKIDSFFELYKKLDYFIFNINKLHELIKKTLKIMEANKLIEKSAIKEFNNLIIDLILREKNFFKFENINDIRDKLNKEDLFFFDLFLNNNCRFNRVSEKDKENSFEKDVLIIKRTIEDVFYTIKINENFITIEILNYKKINEKVIFEDIFLFIRFVKKVNLNFEMNTLKSIKVGSKVLKINKKKISNYSEYFNDESKIKIIFIK